MVRIEFLDVFRFAYTSRTSGSEVAVTSTRDDAGPPSRGEKPRPYALKRIAIGVEVCGWTRRRGKRTQVGVVAGHPNAILVVSKPARPRVTAIARAVARPASRTSPPRSLELFPKKRLILKRLSYDSKTFY